MSIMKKIDRGAAYLQEHLAMFRCPVCETPYEKIGGHTLSCPNGHTLDLNKKGSATFLKHNVVTEYDEPMLAARRRMLTAGLFAPIVKAVNQQLPSQGQRILDVGTGEGTPLAQLDQERSNPDDVLIGFDLSKAGINLATQLVSKAFFCVADLAQLPFTDNAFDTVMEFFSPSAYREFERVCRPGGKLVKVVPNANYLVELRHALYDESAPQYQYTNDRVVELFADHYPTMQQMTVSYDFPIGKARIADMMAMTPLSWGSDDAHRAALLANPVDAVTVDVSVLTVQMS
ncbi:rRNA large subunit methyltransferase A [Furfurilactobacillus rossiae]|uniref:SAM-dependent methyltransferase n=2 Tax=Furfurilactobacillus rossiae TaxID=231049 RepID=A0A0R1R815_9LACO|nr:SAM-dependent methyltransferase [Furfurilactobacillus rossiae DSM 15814]QLE61706.1 rRNA large subunit methyltransferase A [Furfurilactobacillus rossiae]QLE64510.1 rRNA large subunit methyltransferase A [Furfurilactobacillus rossiae]